MVRVGELEALFLRSPPGQIFYRTGLRIFFQFFPENPYVYFYDVKKEYFKGWRVNLHPIYKAPDGKILKYNQCKPDSLYSKPMYTARQKKAISYDAQRYLMYSTEDFNKCVRTLQGMKRKPAVVSFTYCIINTN